MELNRVIYNRRSIRKYKEDQIDKNIIINILNNAILSPSAHNNQPYNVLNDGKEYAPYVPIKGKETENKKSSFDNYNTEKNAKGINLNQKDYDKAKEIVESYVNENKIQKEEVEKSDYELWQDELNEILEKAKSVDEKFYNDIKQQNDEYRDRHRLEYSIYEKTQSRQVGNEVNDDFFKEHFSDYDIQSGTKHADGIMTSMKLKKGNNLAKLSFTEGEDVIWIDELYVKNKNQGYGTEIVEAIKKYANENGKYVKAYKELSTARGFWDKTLRSDKNSNNDIRHDAEFDEFIN